jgi:hypothetical protein
MSKQRLTQVQQALVQCNQDISNLKTDDTAIAVERNKVSIAYDTSVKQNNTQKIIIDQQELEFKDEESAIAKLEQQINKNKLTQSAMELLLGTYVEYEPPQQNVLLLGSAVEEMNQLMNSYDE